MALGPSVKDYMYPISYPALEFSQAWTEESDSKTGGKCVLSAGNASTPMKAVFSPTAGSPWANAYILHRHPFTPATNWTYPVTAMYPTQADIDNSQCFELDRQDNPGGNMFNWGIQLRFGSGLFIWNRAAKNGAGEWEGPIPDTLPLVKFTPGVAKQLALTCSRDSSRLAYEALCIDDKIVSLPYNYPSVVKAQTPYVNNAFQLDSKGQGKPITCLVRCGLFGF